MAQNLFSILVYSVLFFSSCQGQTTKAQDADTAQTINSATIKEPNFNYTVEVPEGWTVYDTIMQDGLRIRFLLAPESLNADYPSGNVIIASMEGRNINDFTIRNLNYLKSNMAGITILERGHIDSSGYTGQWFTYTKEQNGVTRDMINYLIPVKGFAYMITCETNNGLMNKYRATFDKIARSFKG